MAGFGRPAVDPQRLTAKRVVREIKILHREVARDLELAATLLEAVTTEGFPFHRLPVHTQALPYQIAARLWDLQRKHNGEPCAECESARARLAALPGGPYPVEGPRMRPRDEYRFSASDNDPG